MDFSILAYLFQVHKFALIHEKDLEGNYFLMAANRNNTITIIKFFSVCEQAEFNKSCNLIGSGSGRNFPIGPAVGGKNHKKCFTVVWKPFK